MPAAASDETKTELRKSQRRTARIYLWLVKRQGRVTPAWVCEIRVEQPKTWWQDSRFSTKLKRLVKKGKTKVEIRNERDQMIARELNFWIAGNCP